MDKDSIEGTARKTLGKAEEVGGNVLKDRRMQGQSLYDQAAGGAQEAAGRAKETLAAGAAAAKSVAEGVANADLSELREDLAKLTKTVGELVQNRTEVARRQMTGALDTARDNLAQSTAIARDKAESIEADLESRIQKNPWGAVAIALGVGVLIGKMS